MTNTREIFLSKLRKYVPNQQGIRFDGKDFRLLLGPVVYVFLWQGQAIYIGMSKRGLSRATAGRHIQAQDERQECDEVWVYPTESTSAARQLERLLIASLNPSQNKTSGLKPFIRELMGYAR